MSSIRVYVVLLVVLVQLHSINSKPFFFDLICDFICDDDDDISTTTTSASRDDDDFCDCTPTPRRPNRPGQFAPPAFNMRLPPNSNGMNFSLNNTNGIWSINLDALQPGQNGIPAQPFGGPPTANPTAAAATMAPVTTVAPTTAKK